MENTYKECHHCKGEGNFFDPSEMWPAPCLACNERGELIDRTIETCDNCNGIGALTSDNMLSTPCTKCEGTGQISKLFIDNRVIKCTYCRGIGHKRQSYGSFIVCPECSGSTKIFVALEGINPAQMFDPGYYKEYYQDVSEYSDEMALTHYLNIGIKEGRSPNFFFFPKYYYELYSHLRDLIPDDEKRNIGALLHWLQFGCVQGMQGSPAFDVKYYLHANPDISEILLGTGYPFYHKGFEHWSKIGLYDNRVTSEFFLDNLLKNENRKLTINEAIPESKLRRAKPIIDFIKKVFTQREEVDRVREALRDYNPHDHEIVRDDGSGDLLGRDPSEPIV